MTITISKDFFKFFATAIVSLYATYTIVAGIAQEYIHFAGVANEIGTAVMSLGLFIITFITSLTCIKIKFGSKA
jgi:hypothetical protein